MAKMVWFARASDASELTSVWNRLACVLSFRGGGPGVDQAALELQSIRVRPSG